MKYLHQILKLKKGSLLKVHFNQPTKVIVLDDYNYKKYKTHVTYAYWGGELEKSPYIFEVPSTGLWHVVVERGGYFKPKNIIASVDVITAN
jgi:hypothetical protein